MDSVSQFVLGAAVSVAVMGRRTAVWKAALWGGIAGTLPDLDSFIDFGDAVRNMTFHRGHSHGLFWLSLGAPLLAAVAAWLGRERPLFLRWWLAMGLALVTHPLLDTLTVYGTQLLQPFSDRPFAIGSIFIIDPLYTLPLLAGLALALARRGHRGLAWNRWGLGLSCGYLAWTVAAQWHVRLVAEETLAARGEPTGPMLVAAAPLNTLLWRMVVMREDRYLEGFYSLLDPQRSIRWRSFERHPELYQQLGHVWAVQRMAWFTRGFYTVHEHDGQAFITDLRMGQEPGYVFSFRVAQRGSNWEPVEPVNMGWRGDVPRALAWTWGRMLGRDLPPLEAGGARGPGPGD